MKDTVLEILDVMKSNQYALPQATNYLRVKEFGKLITDADILDVEKRLKAAKAAHPFSGTPWGDAYHALRDAGTFRVPHPRARGTDAERAARSSDLLWLDEKGNPERTHFYAKGFHHFHVVFEDWSAAAWDCLLGRYVVCDDIREFQNH